MPVLLTAIIGLNATIFGALGVWGVRLSRNEPSPRLRTLARALTAVSLAFVISAIARMASLGVREGWIPGQLDSFLVSEWILVQSIAVTGLGVGGLFVVRQVSDPIRQADRIAAALSDRLPSSVPLDELGFTARELEVLDVIANGELSDKGIGEILFISPSTAGTHVKNIMRKASVSSRRDLLLLTAMHDRSVGDKP